MTQSIFSHTLKLIDGEQLELGKSSKKVFLVVNTASACGFTRQYEGLEKLHEIYSDKGLQVIGIPSNDYGAQEPGTHAEIMDFCRTKFSVQFPLTEKTTVKGNDKSAFIADLLHASDDKSDIKWNFEKFLFSKNQPTVKRYGSKVEPLGSELENDIKQWLGNN